MVSCYCNSVSALFWLSPLRTYVRVLRKRPCRRTSSFEAAAPFNHISLDRHMSQVTSLSQGILQEVFPLFSLRAASLSIAASLWILYLRVIWALFKYSCTNVAAVSSIAVGTLLYHHLGRTSQRLSCVSLYLVASSSAVLYRPLVVA